jgi:hypothetical protein
MHGDDPGSPQHLVDEGRSSYAARAKVRPPSPHLPPRGTARVWVNPCLLSCCALRA